MVLRNEPTEQVSLRLRISLIDKLDLIAESLGVNKQTIFKIAINEFIANHVQDGSFEEPKLNLDGGIKNENN